MPVSDFPLFGMPCSNTQSNADILSVVEMTPDWEYVMSEQFSDVYPYRAFLTRIDHMGSAIFSRFPITQLDTIFYNYLPNLEARLQVNSTHQLAVYSSNTDPPLYRRSFEQLRDQLDVIATNITEKNCPSVTCGNYNLDQFSDELQDFRAKAHLNDSRKSLSPSLNPPTNHIFYNQSFECLSFQNMYNDNSERIGIFAEFQYLNGYEHASAGIE